MHPDTTHVRQRARNAGDRVTHHWAAGALRAVAADLLGYVGWGGEGGVGGRGSCGLGEFGEQAEGGGEVGVVRLVVVG